MKTRDAQGGSPWVGRAATLDQYRRLPPAPKLRTFDPPSDNEVLVDGHCAVCATAMQFQLGAEMSAPGHGYVLRKALSCQTCPNHWHFNARFRAALQSVAEHFDLHADAAVCTSNGAGKINDALASRYGTVVGFEHQHGAPDGAVHDGVRCEDFARLSFADAQFDAFISLDVLELVPVYPRAIAEMARVLKPGGRVLVTTPLRLDREDTMPRATLSPEGAVIALMPEVYNANWLGEPSLWFTDFGWELLDDFREAGFVDCHVALYANDTLGYYGPPQPLILARKA